MKRTARRGITDALAGRLRKSLLGAELTHHLKTGRSPAEQAVDEQGERAEPDGTIGSRFF